MDDMNFYNKHYITVDDQNRITDGWSDGPHPKRDTTGATLLTDKGGYQFRLYPDGEENPQLYTEDDICLYKLAGSVPVPRTAEEIEADRAALPVPDTKPTNEERIAELEEALELLLSGVTE